MQKPEEPGEAAEHPIWGDSPDKIDGPCILGSQKVGRNLASKQEENGVTTSTTFWGAQFNL